jgi:hypothetical protein
MLWVAFALIFLAGGAAGVLLMCLISFSAETSQKEARHPSLPRPPMDAVRTGRSAHCSRLPGSTPATISSRLEGRLKNS